jgi:hypothetical protein
MTDATHTPGPWFDGGDGYIWDGDPALGGAEIVASTGGPNESGNARRIVRAVNVHDDMLAALEAMLTKHDDRDGASDLWPKEAAQARAALAKARGTNRAPRT